MQKHKLIIKQFRNRERIRQSYGLCRLKTTYCADDDEEDQQQILETVDSKSENFEEESYTFQNFFEGVHQEDIHYNYNPYDIFINEGNSQAETTAPSRISIINKEYTSKMQEKGETSVAPQKKVRFNSEIEVIVFEEERPISDGQIHLEMKKLSFS